MTGNWTWVRNGCHVIDEKRRKVAEVRVTYCDEAELNRRGQAIAAVPEMIAALVSAPNPDGYTSQDDFMDAYDAWLVAQCGTALSRALTPEEE